MHKQHSDESVTGECRLLWGDLFLNLYADEKSCVISGLADRTATGVALSLDVSYIYPNPETGDREVPVKYIAQGAFHGGDFSSIYANTAITGGLRIDEGAFSNIRVHSTENSTKDPDAIFDGGTINKIGDHAFDSSYVEGDTAFTYVLGNIGYQAFYKFSSGHSLYFEDCQIERL